MAQKKNDNAVLICVAGAIGAGKTTLAGKLARALGAKLLEEEVSGNELLEEFYRDPLHYALPVQGRFLLSRFSQLRADNWPKAGIVVTDYVFDKDPLFAELNLQKPQLEIYRGLWQSVWDQVHQPQAIIYLRAQPGLLLERIGQRDRPFERGITIDYLQQLVHRYEKMFAQYQPCPVIRIASDSEPSRHQQSWKGMIGELIRAVPELAPKAEQAPGKTPELDIRSTVWKLPEP